MTIAEEVMIVKRIQNFMKMNENCDFNVSTLRTFIYASLYDTLLLLVMKKHTVG